MKNIARNATITAVVILVLLIAAITLGIIFHVLLEILYVTLFVLAILMGVATALQIYSIVVLVRTVTTVRDEVKPLAASLQETANLIKDTAKTAGHTISTIRSTTQLTREFALVPTVHGAAIVVAAQRVLRIFLGKGYARTRAEQRRREQMEAVAANGEKPQEQPEALAANGEKPQEQLEPLAAKNGARPAEQMEAVAANGESGEKK